MQQDDMLVTTLYDQDGYSYHIRKMTETVWEYYAKFSEEDKNSCNEIEQML